MAPQLFKGRFAAAKHRQLGFMERSTSPRFLTIEMGITRSEVIRTVLFDWLIGSNRLPIDAIDGPHGIA